MDCRATFYFAGIRLYIAGKRRPKPPRDRVFPVIAIEEWDEHKKTVELVDADTLDEDQTESSSDDDGDE